MKRTIFIILCFFSVLAVFSQTKHDSLIINSLSLLDSALHMNFKKSSEYILVYYDNDYFIYNKYYKKRKNNLNRINILYKLKAIDNNSYSFYLKWASEINGTIDYEDGKMVKLEFVESIE
jgi:hypothetical protein